MIAHLIDDNGAEAKFHLPQFDAPRTWLWRKGRMWSWQADRDTETPKGEIIAVYRPTHAFDISEAPAIEGSIVNPPKAEPSPAVSASASATTKEKAYG